MSSSFSYRDYVTDEDFMKGYREYQQKYVKNIRESDKVLIHFVRRVIESCSDKQKNCTLLDIGCSTGNLLLHLKRAIPGLNMVGGDMAGSVVEQCRKNPELSGIRFEQMDMLSLDKEGELDIVIANAVLYMFSHNEFDRALKSVARALKKDGWFITFDLFHPFEQDLSIFEISKTHPSGLMLHFRPYPMVERSLKENGFDNISFEPFSIPIELPKPECPDELNTYTVRSEQGERMLFRGVLYQPWCHLAAQQQRV